MAGKSAVTEGYFDKQAFWNDVLKWKERRRYTNYDIAAIIQMDRGILNGLVSHRATPSLLLVCALAYAADLSIDSYVRNPDDSATT